MASLNEMAYTPEEREQIEQEANLENQINIEVEIDGYISKVKAAETQIEDLIRLRDGIMRQGGMDRTTAIECAAVLPNFGNGTPMNAYSTTPTGVRFQVAMEEITLAIGAAIAVAAVALIALITKFISWLFGGPTTAEGGGGGGGGSTPKKLANLARNEKFKEILQTTAKNGIQVKGPKGENFTIFINEASAKNLKEQIKKGGVESEELANKITELSSRLAGNGGETKPIDIDMINSGPVTTFLFDRGDSISRSITDIESKGNPLEAYLVEYNDFFKMGTFKKFLVKVGNFFGLDGNRRAEYDKFVNDSKRIFEIFGVSASNVKASADPNAKPNANMNNEEQLFWSIYSLGSSLTRAKNEMNSKPVSSISVPEMMQKILDKSDHYIKIIESMRDIVTNSKESLTKLRDDIEKVQKEFDNSEKLDLAKNELNDEAKKMVAFIAECQKYTIQGLRRTVNDVINLVKTARGFNMNIEKRVFNGVRNLEALFNAIKGAGFDFADGSIAEDWKKTFEEVVGKKRMFKTNTNDGIKGEI